MKTILDINKLQQISSELHKKSKAIGFIPTMGALHNGHLKLVTESKKKNDITVVSIFVNPAQFSQNEDLTKYPRPFKNDKRLLEEEGIDYLFHPNVKTMYPNGFQTSVSTTNISNILEGKSRPGHFAGMATIVLKLFNIVKPTHAYFGQKDFQQTVVVKQMVKDFNLPINLDVVSTVRDTDGLALSSRNIFLNDRERLQALSLHQSLLMAKEMILKGSKNTQVIKTKVRDFLKNYGLVHLDYIEICNTKNLSFLKTVSKRAVVLIAAHVGKTRLIDNIII
jgi:pantoate--beta-alanine ligase